MIQRKGLIVEIKTYSAVWAIAFVSSVGSEVSKVRNTEENMSVEWGEPKETEICEDKMAANNAETESSFLSSLPSWMEWVTCRIIGSLHHRAQDGFRDSEGERWQGMEGRSAELTSILPTNQVSEHTVEQHRALRGHLARSPPLFSKSQSDFSCGQPSLSKPSWRHSSNIGWRGRSH